MKKILYLFLMLIMLGCGKEPEQKEVIAEKNNNVVEKVETKKDETKVEIKKIKEKKFEILEISTNLGENPTVEIKFSEDIRPENVDAYINISPEINFNILTDKNKIILNGDFKAESSYKIEILKEIKSIKGKSLEENEVKTIVFKEREPKIVFSNEGIILPTNNKKIAFRAMNVKEVNLTVKKVYENNITQFLQELAFKGNGNVFDYRIDEEFYKVGDVILSEEYELNYEKNVWQQIEIDLEGLDNYKGMFVVELSFDKEGADYTFPENMDYWEEESFLRNNARIGKAILLTHMGMIAQKDRDKTVVTVMDILKNEPVKDANVKLISTNNQIVSEGKTNNKGEVSLVGNENTMYAIAEKGEEKSILKFSDARLSYDGYAVDGIFTSDGIKTFMYTDRGIYRPGDEIFLSIIARNEEGSFPEGHPITIDVYTPKGQTFIENYVIKDGKEGFYTYSFKTNKDSETGIWRVRAEIGDKIFTKDISVETIVPYKIKVEAKAPEKINLNENKNFSLDIKSNYLFGAPADKLKYNVELDVREKTINFEKYKNYTFKNPTTFKYNFRDYKEGILNENGEAKVEFDISKISPKNINTVGILTTKVIEEGGRPVINKSSIYFNKFDTYVGIKDLEDRWIKTGEKLNLEVIAVSEDGEDLVPGRKLKYRIYRNEYSWWWDYGNRDDFVRSIKTDRNTVLIYEKEFLSEDKPYTIDYPMDGEGEIFVEVEDIETNQSAGITLHSCTWNDSSTNGKIDKLKIETDKKSYVIGDKAKITFEGTEGAKAIIITEKSGRIIDKKIVDANDLKNIYEIEVTEDMFPNSYISVMLLQNYEKLDNDRPIRLYGAVPIIVKDEAKKLNIKIDAPKEVMPNEEFVVKVKNEEKEKMNYTIAIVDEGILDITDFKTPDPFGYFYQKEAMQIDFYDNYSEIMGRIIGKVHGVLKTGGDGFINEARKLSLSSRSKDLGIEDNERFKPVAMYKGVLTTDENGEGSVKFTMPNYMGAVKVMVVGASGEKYGNTSSEIVVKAPIVVDTTLPRVLKVGDIFKIPVSVFATEDEVGKVKINLDFMGKEQKETIKFDKKGKKTIYFDVQTPKKVGNEKINISAMSSKYNYKEETNISINSDNPYIYINKIEVLEKGKDLVFKNPSEYVEGTPKGSIIVSNSPILGADKRLSELIRYPYGCGEQIVSAAFPQMYINMLTNNNKFDRKEITGNVNVTIGEISERQLYDGSFPYW